ncbi:hypothetical protein SRABI84_01349 [Peribacillus simplex]|uniref:hypothetical protein n=1 Tax=Peribacillus simplex TaxID=1478 RepID=UPI001D95F55C|nr:hypothetical protein [Peribacillus simplex]CAH0177885.1 hypothetical protein SRABI84_01349 [Peribacillus simplex]
MLANLELRERIKSSKVYMYQIADALGIHENTLYRLLRKELPISKKTEMLNVLNELQLNNIRQIQEN